MMAARGRFACFVCIVSAVTVEISGCAVSGKSLYIDSNSRVPFFGLELKERKSKTNGPSYNSISRSSADKSRVEAAIGGGSSTSVDLLKKGDKRLATARVSGTADHSSELLSVSEQATKSKSVLSIPLPRTDDDPSSPDRHVAPAVIDFE